MRVGIAYAVIGWILAQIAEFAFENFGAPEWVLKTVVVLLLPGLPLALFFAWSFEMTPDGVKKRSIAVLPFVNMSSDQEQEWFSDGLTEELLNTLARTPDLLVAARASSFKY